jgi:hypothetical protein
MRIYNPKELEDKLRQRTGFFKGLWLLLCLVWRFLWSLGPKNWNLQKITNAGRVDPSTLQHKSAAEVLVQTIDVDRKSP